MIRKATNLNNQRSCELRGGNILALVGVRLSSPLRRHVGHVVVMGAKEEVVGTNAGRIVAMVTDEHSRRDRTVRQLIRNAVNQCRLPIAKGDTVSVTVTSAFPNPTIVRFTNASPKAFNVERGAKSTVARLATVLAASAFDDVWIGEKGGVTDKTANFEAVRLGGHILNLLHRFGSAAPRTVPAVAGFSRALSISENRMVMGVSEVSTWRR